MPQNDVEKQIEARLAELPQEVRDAVLSADLPAQLQEIGRRNNLHIDQIGKLQDETMLVMLGFFDLDQFDEQLSQQLGIPPQAAAVLAQDVNEHIFMPIRQFMKGATNEQSVVPPAPPSPPVMPTAEATLTQPTTAKPIYKTDPYREPIE